MIQYSLTDNIEFYGLMCCIGILYSLVIALPIMMSIELRHLQYLTSQCKLNLNASLDPLCFTIPYKYNCSMENNDVLTYYSYSCIQCGKLQCGYYDGCRSTTRCNKIIQDQVHDVLLTSMSSVMITFTILIYYCIYIRFIHQRTTRIVYRSTLG
ncbi:hypothetical protein GJ496_001298 [Pomphorhynchus laevis]|nr:hypothetical protein GJ496_001298 [Pomphorhynchus laevis]